MQDERLVTLRLDLTGQLAYLDEGMRLFLKADRFKFDNRGDGEVAISGNGRLQNGTAVSFTIVGSSTPAGAREVSITMNNGYFATGVLTTPRRLEACLHVVAPGGNSLKIPR